MFRYISLHIIIVENVEYHYTHGAIHQVTVGGAVEPFAFSLSDEGAVPSTGLLAGQTSGIVHIDSDVPNMMDMQHMGGASSYAPGLFVDTLPDGLSDDLSLRMKYWSVVDKLPSVKDTLFADGGCYENILVSSMLQRRVEKLVLFFNSHLPLQPASSWNVDTEPFTGDEVTGKYHVFMQFRFHAFTHTYKYSI